MLNILIFLTSFLVQFGALTLPQTVEVPEDFNFNVFISSARDDMVNRGDVFSYYGDISIQEFQSNLLFMKYTKPSNFVYRVTMYLPSESFNSSLSSAFRCYYADNYGTTVIANISLYNYATIVYDFDISSNTVTYMTSTVNSSPEFSAYYPINSNDSETYLFINTNIDYNGVNYLTPGTYNFVDTSQVDFQENQFQGFFDGGVFGHSQGGLSEAGQAILNGTYSWSGTPKQDGHNTNGLVHPSSSSFDYTNPLQNLLGQIVDNTNDIIGNTNNIVYDIRNGFTALINSTLNIGQNVASFFNYVTEPLDMEHLNSTIEDSIFFQNINRFFDIVDYISNSASSNLTDNDDLVIYYDLRPVYNVFGSVSFNSFLGSSKSVWQPFLLTFLYATVVFGFIHSLPNLVNGLGGTLSNNTHTTEKKGDN